MGVVIRQSIITSIITYIGVVIGYINLLYLYPKFLEPGEIGLLRTVQDAAMLLVPFATIGLAQGIVKYFPQYSHERKKMDSFVSLIVAIAICAFLVMLGVFYLFETPILSVFKEKAASVIRFKNLVLLLTFILLFTTIFEQFSKVLLKVAFPNLLREVLVRLLHAILVTLYFVSILTFDQFIASTVYAYAFSLLILVFFLMKQKVGFNFANITSFSRSRVREILMYSSLSFVAVSAMIIIGKMDSLMITSMLGLEPVAVYTTAFYMATVIEVPKRAITQTTTPLLAQSFERNDHVSILSLYQKTSLNQFIIGMLLMIGIWANLDNVFQLIPNGDIYAGGASVVVLIGLGKLIDMAFGPSSEIIGLSRHYWFNLVSVSALAIMVVIGNYYLIPRFGIDGAAYGSAIALIIFNTVKCIFIYRTLKMQPFTSGTLKLIVISLLVVGLNLMLPKLSNVLADIIYRSSTIAICFTILILATRTSADVNKVFVAILHRFGIRK